MNIARTKLFIVCALIFTFVIVPSAIAEKDDNGINVLRKTGKAFAGVAKKAIPAVVSVKVEKNLPANSYHNQQPPMGNEFFEHFFGPRYRQPSPRSRKQVGQGSGFLISEDGYILTNNHVVGAADKITVTLNDSREFEAKLIGADPSTDVAIIKIEGKSLPFIELGDSDALEIGEWAIAVGNPFGLNASVTVGVVSAKGRSSLGITGRGGYEDFIQTDAAINPGNSGGPLLNIDGKAVGLNTAIFSQSGGYMGIGFAIPINMARNVKDQLVKFGKVERGFVGIYMDQNEITPDLAKLFGLKENHGVIITDVIPGSPAEKAGLKSDDVILELNDKVVKNYLTFRNGIAMLAPGTEIKLKIFRDGKDKTIKLKIGSQSDAQVLLNVSSPFAKEFGIVVEDITDELAEKLNHKVGQGVVVSQVASGSSASQKGITPAMVVLSVDRVPVGSVVQFNEVFEALKKKDAKSVWLLMKIEGAATYKVLSRN
jgi:serine protease Do